MDLYAPRRRQLYLVDDDVDVLAALKFRFEADGYEVTTLASGEALLSLPQPDELSCVIIDQRLSGMTGVETLQQLRAKGVKCPAVVITTYPSIHLRERAAQLGAEIVEKPLLGDNLERRVAALMRN